MTDPTTPMPPQQPGEPTSQQAQPEPTPPDALVDPPGPPIAAEQADTASSTVTPAAPGRSRTLAWVAGGIAVGVILVGGISVVSAARDDGAKSTASATAAGAAPSPTTAAPTTAAPTTAAPTTAAPPTRTAPPPKPKPVSYKTLSERQWKLIAKDPDAHIGKTYIVYGVVTQFDSATGTDTFRADVGHKRMSEEYEYRTNTLLTGSESRLKNLVEGDVFRAKVRVLGSFSYDTQIGGETTAPLLQVDSITVL